MDNIEHSEHSERAAANAVSLQASKEPTIGSINFMTAERLAMAALDAADYRGAVEALAELLRIKEGPHDDDRLGDATRAWAEARAVVNRSRGQ